MWHYISEAASNGYYSTTYDVHVVGYNTAQVGGETSVPAMCTISVISHMAIVSAVTIPRACEQRFRGHPMRGAPKL